MKALVIDDSETTRMQLQLFLEQLYQGEVTCSINGQDALRIMEADHDKFDVIFCDINMPIMGGFQFMEALNDKNLHECPIVVISTEGGGFIKEQGKELGAKAWIMKPFNKEKIQKVVDHILELKAS